MGCGAGKSLLQAAAAEARKRANDRLWLKVNAHNARAIEFYARQGCRKVGTTYFAFGGGQHENHVLIRPDATGCVAR